MNELYSKLENINMRDSRREDFFGLSSNVGGLASASPAL